MSDNGNGTALTLRREPTLYGIYEPQCKICRLSRKAPEIVDEIHSLRFKEHLSYRQIIARANTMIESRQLEIKPLNIPNLVAHFSSHVPADNALVHDLQTVSMGRPRQSADSGLMARAVNAKRENFERLQNTLDKWQIVIDRLFERTGLGQVDERGDDKIMQLTSEDIQQMRTATSALTSIAAIVDKAASDEALISNVVEFTMAALLTRLSQRFGQSFANLAEEISTRSPSDPSTIEWYDRQIRMLVVQVMDGMRDEVRDEVSARFNLR